MTQSHLLINDEKPIYRINNKQQFISGSDIDDRLYSEYLDYTYHYLSPYTRIWLGDMNNINDMPFNINNHIPDDDFIRIAPELYDHIDNLPHSANDVREIMMHGEIVQPFIPISNVYTQEPNFDNSFIQQFYGEHNINLLNISAPIIVNLNFDITFCIDYTSTPVALCSHLINNALGCASNNFDPACLDLIDDGGQCSALIDVYTEIQDSDVDVNNQIAHGLGCPHNDGDMLLDYDDSHWAVVHHESSIGDFDIFMHSIANYPSATGRVGYKYFVLNWDWEEGDEDAGDFSSLGYSFPQTNSDLSELQLQGLFKVEDVFNVVNIGDASYDIYNNTMSHFYETHGIKIIKAIVFSYGIEHINEYDPSYALVGRSKYVTIKFNTYDSTIIEEDFSDLGGINQTTIPWNNPSLIINGFDDNSVYYNSLNDIYKSNPFDELSDIQRKDSVESALTTDVDEMGVSVGDIDLSQIRMFNTGSFTMQSILFQNNNTNILYNSDYWTGNSDITTIPGNSAVLETNIDNIMVNEQNNCIIELNFFGGEIFINKTNDTSGNNNFGLFVGDYSLSKETVEDDLTLNSSINYPKKASDDGAF